MNNINCFINTPTKSYSMEPGEMILLPAAEGEMGVLYGHMDMVIDLIKGTIVTLTDDKIIEKIEITDESYIAYIKSDKVEIFCNNYKLHEK